MLDLFSKMGEWIYGSERTIYFNIVFVLVILMFYHIFHSGSRIYAWCWCWCWCWCRCCFLCSSWFAIAVINAKECRRIRSMSLSYSIFSSLLLAFFSSISLCRTQKRTWFLIMNTLSWKKIYKDKLIQTLQLGWYSRWWNKKSTLCHR